MTIEEKCLYEKLGIKPPVISYDMQRSDGLEYSWACYTEEQWKKFHEGFQKLIDETGIVVMNCGSKKP